MASKAAERASESAGQASEGTESALEGAERASRVRMENKNNSRKSITWSAVCCAPLVSLKLNLKLAK